MARFQFRLQRVLDYRTSLSEAQEVELSRALRSLRQAQAELEAIQREERERLAEMAEGVRGVIPVERVAGAWRYLGSLREREETIADDVRRYQRQVAEERQKLVELKRDEQVMAKLRARQRARAETAAKLAEAKVLDDLTSTRHRLNQAVSAWRDAAKEVSGK